MFRKLPDKNKIISNANNNYSHQNQNDKNEFVYIDNVNQVLDFRKLSIDANANTNANSTGIRVNNNLNSQYQNINYGNKPSVNYGSYSSYSMQMNYANGYDSTSNNIMNGYDMNDDYTNAYNNSSGAIVNEKKENTISEWIIYNNRQEFYNRVDNNQNGDEKYYNYSNYSSSNMNSYMKNNFQQIPNSGIQYSGIVSERQSIPYYETLPIPIYTTNTIENNNEDNSQHLVFDENANPIQEKYTLTSKPETPYSLTTPNPILTSANSYLFSKTTTTTTTSEYYSSSDTKPIAIMSNTKNNEDNNGYDKYNHRMSISKPLLNSYSNTSSSYLGNSYSNPPVSSHSTTEYNKRLSISSRSSNSQNYPMVVTTSQQSNLNSRHPYSTIIDGSSSQFSKQRYNYDYQYQRSVPSTSYYNGVATESIEESGNKIKEEEENENSENEKSLDDNETNETEHRDDLNSETYTKSEGEQIKDNINNNTDSNNNSNIFTTNTNDNNQENKDNKNENESNGKEKQNEEGNEHYQSNKMLKKNGYSKQGSFKRSSFFSQVIESNNFKCPWPDCDQSFASVTLLNAHEIYSHGTPYPPYPLPQPTYAELADARHRLLWHIKNNISTNPLNIYNSNYCSSVQSPNSSSIYSSDSPYSRQSAKIPTSATSSKSSESANTFTDLKNSSNNDDDDGKKNKENPEKYDDDATKESHIIKKISKMKGDIPHLNIDNINSNRSNKSSPEGRTNSVKYTQSLSSSSTTMQSLRVQIKVDIKEHLFHYLFTPYIRYSHYTKTYSCFFEGLQGRSIVGEILEDPNWDIRCEDEYSVSYIKMVEGSREAGILFSWERKKVDEWFPSAEDENERPTLYNDIVTINFVVASTKKR